jgi:hypothetical protein
MAAATGAMVAPFSRRAAANARRLQARAVRTAGSRRGGARRGKAR